MNVELRLTFVPKEDITAYELARIAQKIPLNAKDMRATKDQWDAVDEGLKRHFVVEMVELAKQ